MPSAAPTRRSPWTCRTRPSTGADGEPVHFEIDQGLKHMLVEGLDEIGLTMKKAPSVSAHENRVAETRPWI